MNVLILASRPLVSRSSGYDLRVANLCAQTPGPLHLVIAPLAPLDHADETLSTAGLFESVEILAPLLHARQSPRRHLRVSDDHFLRRASPDGFAAARDRLREVVEERRVTQVVAFGGNLAELAGTVPGHVILDVCDSVSLTLRREIEAAAAGPTGRAGWKARLDLRRYRATEAGFPRRFERVSAVGLPDAREIERLAGPGSEVVTVPNGVDDAFLGPLPEPASRRGVAFWGNLGFAPNQEALQFFMHEVYRPILRPAGVECCLVGPNAPAWLQELAADDPGVVLPGFVSDLGASVTRYPVMVNPMRTGSGLKNKVLEAFGLGLVVVSTPLGMDGLPGTLEGTHYVGAEDAVGFGTAIVDLLADQQRRLTVRADANQLLHQRYRWEVVGSTWRELFSDHPLRDSHSSPVR